MIAVEDAKVIVDGLRKDRARLRRWRSSPDNEGDRSSERERADGKRDRPPTVDRRARRVTSAAAASGAADVRGFDSAEIGQTMSEIVAYGTAAVIEPIPG